MKISAILLAAGLSRRMGEDKLLLAHGGESLFERAVKLLSELPVFERIVVTTGERFGNVAVSDSIRVILNDKPEIGQSESIKLGVSAAVGSHFMFLVADQPKLSVSALEPILVAVRDFPDKIVFPLVRGEPSSPTVFPAGFKVSLLALSGDMGGREVRRAHPDVCLGIAADNPDDFIDIDDFGDYALWRKTIDDYIKCKQ